MKIKSPIGFLVLWSAFLAVGTWILPTRAFAHPTAHVTTSMKVGPPDSPKLIYLEDVLLSGDDDLHGDPVHQICLRLGIPLAKEESIGFVGQGGLSRGLEFAVMSGEADSGFHIGLQLDARLELQTIRTTTQEGRSVVVRMMLFSGVVSHADMRLGVLGLALSTSVSASVSDPSHSATIMLPLGETSHAGIASAFVRQTETLLQNAGATNSWDDDQNAADGGIECMPECQCQCGIRADVCRRIAVRAFWVCIGLTLTTAHAILLGTCLIGCAATSAAFLPCFYGCARLVAAAALQKMKHCVVGSGAAFLACDLGLSDCLNGCSP